ncbi:hypothetical protein HI914_02318 [Erysiphe necator]|nr:hypothetical protein HI914_02318 [Erysiphe necator]
MYHGVHRGHVGPPIGGRESILVKAALRHHLSIAKLILFNFWLGRSGFPNLQRLLHSDTSPPGRSREETASWPYQR